VRFRGQRQFPLETGMNGANSATVGAKGKGGKREAR
jgi:hypothetical protein